MSNQDRELLELAARAAGIDANLELDGTFSLWAGIECTQSGWNPLTDDGDALRLAVRLDIEPKFLVDTVQAVVVADPDGDAWETCLAEEKMVSDKLSATRRAIVRAAAEIGKAMGDGE